MIDLSVLVNISAALSEKYGVHVQVDGENAFTAKDRDTHKMVINVPMLECEDEKYYEMVRGYIDHEAAHVRFTDMDLAQDEKPMVKTFHNIVEDVYIEREMSRCYAGCRTNFAQLVEHLFADPEYGKPPKERMSFEDKMWAAVTNYTILKLRGMEYRGLEENAEAIRKRISKAFKELPGKIDEALGVGRSTAENLDIAKRIYGVVMGYLKEKAQTPTAAIPGTTGNKAQKMIEAESRMNAAQDALEEMFRREVEEKKEGGATCAQHINASDVDEYAMYSPEDMTNESIIAAGQASVAMRARLEGLLQARDLTRSMSGRVGRIDSRRLARLRVGDDRVFRRQWIEKKTNTEVIILCDASGSMDGTRKRVTDQSLYAIMQTLNTIKGADASLFHFSNNNLVRVVPFDGRLSRKVALDPQGGTVLGASILRVLQYFRPATLGRRRILIVLSDGETYDAQVMPTAIRVANRMGVEQVYIGIETTAMESFDVDTRSINDIHELPKAMFDILGEKLLRRAA